MIFQSKKASLIVRDAFRGYTPKQATPLLAITLAQPLPEHVLGSARQVPLTVLQLLGKLS
jgi:hypothetical protein